MEMDTGTFRIRQVEEKFNCNDFNEDFQINAVKNKPRDINSSNRSETYFEDHNYHKHFTDSCQEQIEEKLYADNLNPKNLDHSKFLENLSTSTCSSVGIKNEHIEIFNEDIKFETGEKISRECCRCECSCQKQNSELQLLEVQDEEVTRERRDASAIPRRLSVLPAKNGNEMKHNFSPEPLENFLCVAKKTIQCKIRQIVHSELHEGGQAHGKRFQCKICTKSFSQKSNMNVHMRIHTRKLLYHCNICANAFTSLWYLRNHEKIHTGDELFHCKICSKSFFQKDILQVHERIHTAEKPFQCQICSKSFSHMRNMNVHMKVHKLENPLCCNICSKAFINSWGLRAHMKIHTGEKPFYCKVCSKSFSQKSNLRVHMRVHTMDGSAAIRCRPLKLLLAVDKVRSLSSRKLIGIDK